MASKLKRRLRLICSGAGPGGQSAALPGPWLPRLEAWVQRSYEVIHRIAQDRPGQRFSNYYARRGRREHPIRTGLYLALGSLLLLVGTVLGWLPLLPGFLLVAVGLTLIVPRARWAAQALDRLELRLRAFYARRRRR